MVSISKSSQGEKDSLNFATCHSKRSPWLWQFFEMNDPSSRVDPLKHGGVGVHLNLASGKVELIFKMTETRVCWNLKIKFQSGHFTVPNSKANQGVGVLYWEKEILRLVWVLFPFNSCF